MQSRLEEILPAFAHTDLVEPRRIAVGRASNPVRNRSGFLPITTAEYYYQNIPVDITVLAARFAGSSYDYKFLLALSG
jgi:hypothetical protein